jgi:type 1 glutamine amidotransferase
MIEGAHTMSLNALVVWGGWDGHEPRQVADICRDVLVKHGFNVEVSDTLDAFLNYDELMKLNLIVPIWTMGKISGEQQKGVLEAVKSGVGLAGCHGGMCDSFRDATDWQFMTGGQWVAHPGNDGTNYRVRVTNSDHFITEGTSDFDVCSEQYYLHTDPGNKVLAVTKFPVADGPHVANGEFDMPVVWTRMWGKGRVFYSSLGHHADIVAQPDPLRLMTRGMLWAALAEGQA